MVRCVSAFTPLRAKELELRAGAGRPWFVVRRRPTVTRGVPPPAFLPLLRVDLHPLLTARPANPRQASLPGGFTEGQPIVAMFTFQGVERGDVGAVVGPCNNSSLTNPEDRINCSFSSHTGCGSLNVLSTQVPGAYSSACDAC